MNESVSEQQDFASALIQNVQNDKMKQLMKASLDRRPKEMKYRAVIENMDSIVPNVYNTREFDNIDDAFANYQYFTRDMNIRDEDKAVLGRILNNRAKDNERALAEADRVMQYYDPERVYQRLQTIPVAEGKKIKSNDPYVRMSSNAKDTLRFLSELAENAFEANQSGDDEDALPKLNNTIYSTMLYNSFYQNKFLDKNFNKDIAMMVDLADQQGLNSPFEIGTMMLYRKLQRISESLTDGDIADIVHYVGNPRLVYDRTTRYDFLSSLKGKQILFQTIDYLNLAVANSDFDRTLKPNPMWGRYKSEIELNDVKKPNKLLRILDWINKSTYGFSARG